MIPVTQNLDILPESFNNTHYLVAKDRVYFMCKEDCGSTRLIMQNNSEVKLYSFDVCEMSMDSLPLKLVTPQTTFSVTKETLIKEKEVELNEKISFNSELNFNKINVEDVFRSLDIESLLEEHNDFMLQISDVNQPVLHITYLASIMFVSIIITIIIVCCRRRRERCYCEQLGVRDLCCCRCCLVRTRAERRPNVPRTDYEASSRSHGDYLDPRTAPVPTRNTIRSASARAGSPSRGRYLTVTTTT